MYKQGSKLTSDTSIVRTNVCLHTYTRAMHTDTYIYKPVTYINTHKYKLIYKQGSRGSQVAQVSCQCTDAELLQLSIDVDGGWGRRLAIVGR